MRWDHGDKERQSDDVHLEDQASRFRWLRAPAVIEIAANAPAHRETMLATRVGTGRVLDNSLET